MPDDDCQCFGQLDTALGVGGVASQLKKLGWTVELRESLHRNGHYLLVSILDDAQVALVWETPREVHIEDEVDHFGALVHTMKRLSDDLSTLSIRHRFEIYDGDDKMTHYLHHDWPVPPAESQQ